MVSVWFVCDFCEHKPIKLDFIGLFQARRWIDNRKMRREKNLSCRYFGRKQMLCIEVCFFLKLLCMQISSWNNYQQQLLQRHLPEPHAIQISMCTYPCLSQFQGIIPYTISGIFNFLKKNATVKEKLKWQKAFLMTLRWNVYDSDKSNLVKSQLLLLIAS